MKENGILVIYTGSLRENEKRRSTGLVNMISHLFCKHCSLILFSPLKDKRAVKSQNVLLKVANQSSVALMINRTDMLKNEGAFDQFGSSAHLSNRCMRIRVGTENQVVNERCVIGNKDMRFVEFGFSAMCTDPCSPRC